MVKDMGLTFREIVAYTYRYKYYTCIVLMYMWETQMYGNKILYIYIYILYSLYSDDSGILINRDIANIDQAKREDRPSKGRWIADIESRLGKCKNIVFPSSKVEKRQFYVRAMLQAVHVCASNAEFLLILNPIPWCMYHTGQAHLSLIILRCEKKRCYVTAMSKSPFFRQVKSLLDDWGSPTVT